MHHPNQPNLHILDLFSCQQVSFTGWSSHSLDDRCLLCVHASEQLCQVLMCSLRSRSLTKQLSNRRCIVLRREDNPQPFSFLTFFFSFHFLHDSKKGLKCYNERWTSPWKFKSGRSPLKVAAAGTSRDSPVPTAEEHTSLLRPRLPNHSFVTLHPTETVGVVVE